MPKISLIMSTAREKSETFFSQWQELASDLRAGRPSKYRPLSLIRSPFRELLLNSVNDAQESFLEPTLESLTEQTFQDFEFILVDWHADERMRASERYADRLSIRHVRDKPCPWFEMESPVGWESGAEPSFPNVSGARNTGAMLAEGELLCFIDDNILLEPKTLETCWKWHKRGRGVKLIRNRWNLDGRKILFEPEFRSPNYNVLWFKGQTSYSYRGAWSHGFTVPLKAFLDVNGFEEVLLAGTVGAEDIDMGARLHNYLEGGGENQMVLDVNATAWETGHLHIHHHRPCVRHNIHLLNAVRDWEHDTLANTRKPTEEELEKYLKLRATDGTALHPYWRKFPIESFSLKELRDKYKSGEFKW